nr:U4/U6 small nuclear ribonucleoprotein Prp31 [Paratrimastix eleionoma]
MQEEVKEFWATDIEELGGGDDEDEPPTLEKKQGTEVKEDETPEDNPDVKALAPLKIDDLAKVLKSDALQKHLVIVKAKIQLGRGEDAQMSQQEHDEEYQLIVKSNQFAIQIDDEMNQIHKYTKDLYAKRFPELDQIVMTPLDYVQVVKAIGNHVDMSNVNLQGILPPNIILTVEMTASMSLNRVLPEDIMSEVMKGCDEVLALENARQQILNFVESRMQAVAPNLCALVGPNIAAKLMAVAGGLGPLSRIPACNIQILGAKKKHNAGFSTATTLPHTGFIYLSPVVMSAPSDFRMKATRVAAGRVALCARLDFFHDQPTGSLGQQYKEELEKKIEKWQEAPPAKLVKPLPVPETAANKKRRGGQRARKLKEKYAMTEMRKQQNRMTFAVAEPEFRDSGVGFGVLGASGSGQLRVTKSKTQKLRLSKKAQKGISTPGGRSSSSGFSTSLSFTPVQGIELEDPKNRAPAALQLADRYFNRSRGFDSLIHQKRPREESSTSTTTTSSPPSM